MSILEDIIFGPPQSEEKTLFGSLKPLLHQVGKNIITKKNPPEPLGTVKCVQEQRLPYGDVFKEYVIVLEQLPSALDGVRILHLSDTHMQESERQRRSESPR